LFTMQYLLMVLIATGIVAHHSPPPVKIISCSPARLKCYGRTPCYACTSCNYCQYCNAGGTCGVCEKVKRKITIVVVPKRKITMLLV
jgi:hypothetical protein